MQISFDVFNQQEKPSITLCNPDHTELYSLNACYDTEVSLKWNAQSEFSFTFPKTINGTEMEVYDYIEGKRVVKVENLGYFIIYSVVEDFDGSVPIKRVTCLSQESELVYKRLAAFSGTYQFYNPSVPNDNTTLIGIIFALMPNWSVGNIDSTIAALYRTFDVSDTNIYNFLTVDVETAYGCVFIFDYENRRVSVVPSNQSPEDTDIFLSFDNLINNTEYTEVTNEIATCLYCYGGNGLTIRYVNPLGTNAIYDFTYYKTTEWMTQDLINAVTAWENKVSSYGSYYTFLLAVQSGYNAYLLTYRAELVELQTQLAADQETKAVRVQQGLDTTEIDARIAQDEQWISEKNIQISNTENSLSEVAVLLASVNTELTFSSNFTANQLLELDNFIFEGTYSNDSITVTESMTFTEIQEQSQQLYDAATEVLAKAAVPRYEITISAVNFLALKAYQVFISQLELGGKVVFDSGKGYFVEATLLEIRFSYDDLLSFEIVLGNRNRLDNSSFQLTDFIGQGSTSTSGGETLFLTAGGTGTIVMEDLTPQTGANFSVENTYIAGSLRVFVNGILQRLGATYTEGNDRRTFTMLDSVLLGDTLVVEYMK